ncbi:MAG: hypothetical protein SPL56_01455 [Lachnospiraceae bacterium]|nr:hypothetical protein [Lachnospiraceae bacterium]
MNEARIYENMQKTPPKKYPAPEPRPANCSKPCCYGYGHSYCFPCMKKILEEHRAGKKEQ